MARMPTTDFRDNLTDTNTNTSFEDLMNHLINEIQIHDGDPVLLDMIKHYLSIKEEEKRELEELNTRMPQEQERRLQEIMQEPENKMYISDADGDGCSICLMPFCRLEKENRYRVPPSIDVPVKIRRCGHMFHLLCLRNNCRTIGNTLPNCRCPLCRQIFNFNDHMNMNGIELLTYACPNIARKLNYVIDIHKHKYNIGVSEIKQRYDKEEKKMESEIRKYMMDEERKLTEKTRESERKLSVRKGGFRGGNSRKITRHYKFKKSKKMRKHGGSRNCNKKK